MRLIEAFLFVCPVFVVLVSFHLCGVRPILTILGCTRSGLRTELSLVLAKILKPVVLQVLSFVKKFLIQAVSFRAIDLNYLTSRGALLLIIYALEIVALAIGELMDFIVSIAAEPLKILAELRDFVRIINDLRYLTTAADRRSSLVLC